MKIFIIELNYETPKISYKDTCYYTAEYELKTIKHFHFNATIRLTI